MATVTVQFAGAQTATHSRTVSDADITRLLNAERAIRGLPAATNGQIIALIAQDFFQLLRMRTRQAEADAARNAVTDIVVE